MKSLYRHYRRAILERLRIRFAEREESAEAAFAIQEMLKLPAAEAEGTWRAGAARRRQLHRLLGDENVARAYRKLRRVSPAYSLAEALRELEKHAETSYLLALPLTVSSVLLLARLADDESRHFRILGTPLTRRYLAPLASKHARERVQFVSSSQMLAHNRQRIETGSTEAVTYITFPDHETTAGDTMWRVSFLDDEYHLTTLEPLLFFRGLAPLFTVAPGANGTAVRLALVACPTPGITEASSGADVQRVLEWLAGHMERTFRETPSDVLSWTHALLRSASTKGRITVMKLKMVEGYLRAWQSAAANLSPEVYSQSVAELRKLQERANAPERATAEATT
jgi:hypothetical protein